MRIQGRKSNSIGPAELGGSQSAPEAPATEAPTPAEGDRIEISAQSREIGQLRQAAAALPDVRLERIDGIRDAVEEGHYHVESEKIAKRVVDEALGDAIHQARVAKR